MTLSRFGVHLRHFLLSKHSIYALALSQIVVPTSDQQLQNGSIHWANFKNLEQSTLTILKHASKNQYYARLCLVLRLLYQLRVSVSYLTMAVCTKFNIVYQYVEHTNTSFFTLNSNADKTISNISNKVSDKYD